MSNGDRKSIKATAPDIEEHHHTLGDYYCINCGQKMEEIVCEVCQGKGTTDGLNFCLNCRGRGGWLYCKKCEMKI